METGYSLSPTHIDMYRNWALKAQEDGHRALFVFDSYSSLVANFTQIDEVKAAFAQPLQNLQKALADTGATTIVLHHTAKSGSGGVASSGSGTSRLGRIPDVVISMEAVAKNSDQLILTSSKRIQSTCLLVEQDFEAGRWICHGDGRKAQRERELWLKIAALRGTVQAVHEKAQELWANQRQGFTSKQVEIWTGKSGTTSRNSINAMLAQGLLFQIGEEPTPGTYLKVYLPMICRDEWELHKVRKADETVAKAIRSQSLRSIDPLSNQRKDESAERGEVSQAAQGCVRPKSGIIPCYEPGTLVTINGGGVGVWKVIDINLAWHAHP